MASKAIKSALKPCVLSTFNQCSGFYSSYLSLLRLIFSLSFQFPLFIFTAGQPSCYSTIHLFSYICLSSCPPHFSLSFYDFLICLSHLSLSLPISLFLYPSHITHTSTHTPASSAHCLFWWFCSVPIIYRLQAIAQCKWRALWGRTSLNSKWWLYGARSSTNKALAFLLSCQCLTLFSFKTVSLLLCIG